MTRIAVVGNVSRDTVDGSAPRPGGCPVFAAHAARALGRDVQLLARCADRDLGVFEGLPLEILPGAATAGFEIAYDGETRLMTVTELGDPWTAADAARLGADVAAVHVAPLLRSDFPPDAIAALADGGRRVSLDAQGLVRAPRLGPLLQDAAFDPATLEPVSVLKLSEEEARVVAGGPFDEATARRLGVPEIVVTLGSRGQDVWVDGSPMHVATTPVVGVETTGAGDAFMVAYVSARHDGATPIEAARAGSALVAGMLAERGGST
jgi:sugar/nucleoside kinase (ribokinase family)